jgi:hypothetical protein
MVPRVVEELSRAILNCTFRRPARGVYICPAWVTRRTYTATFAGPATSAPGLLSSTGEVTTAHRVRCAWRPEGIRLGVLSLSDPLLRIDTHIRTGCGRAAGETFQRVKPAFSARPLNWGGLAAFSATAARQRQTTSPSSIALPISAPAPAPMIVPSVFDPPGAMMWPSTPPPMPPMISPVVPSSRSQ